MGGFPMFYTEKEASWVGFPPCFTLKRRPPGWVSSMFYTEKEASWVGFPLCFYNEKEDSQGGFWPVLH